MRSIFSEFVLGDMVLRYLQEDHTLGMQLIPKGTETWLTEKAHDRLESLIQAKIIGDAYPGGYAGGRTMRWSATTDGMRLEEQMVQREGSARIIETVLRDGRGMRWVHTVTYREESRYLTVQTTAENTGDMPVTLEFLTSFCLGGLSPYDADDGCGHMRIYRLRSNWSAEGYVEALRPEAMHLEPAWLRQSAVIERFGQIGSMPVRGFFPLLAVEDESRHVVWAAKLTGAASWQMQTGRRDDGLVMDGGLADREFGSWTKTLAPGERLTAPEAILTAGQGSFDAVSQRLLGHAEDQLCIPESERDLPVLFNEYCTTWGCPREDLICRIVDAVRPLQLRYFVIDAGWYAQKEDDAWWDTVGSWEVSPFLFPSGLDETLAYIRKSGMTPGIWFEIESVGRQNPLFEKTEWLLLRDGIPLQTGNRRYLDFRNAQVRQYARERLIDFLKAHGIGYVKIDYNDSIGLGVDGCESLSEGLRQHIQGVQDFFREIRTALPDIVLEVCSSGGHRIVPSFMALGSMASFSDAHECLEIPVIAAAMHRMILPRQSQIWAVLHREQDAGMLYYKLTAGLLGRLCLSGEVLDIAPWQWAIIRECVDFYRAAAPVIRDGETEFLSPQPVSWRHLTGAQAVVRRMDTQCLVTVHTFAECGDEMCVPVPAHFSAEQVVCRDGIVWTVDDAEIHLSGLRPYDGMGILGTVKEA